MARTGAQWRQLPDEYGKWNSVFRRYRRWVETGVFEAMLETLAELVERDASADMIDSTVLAARCNALRQNRKLLSRLRRHRLSQNVDALCPRNLASVCSAG